MSNDTGRRQALQKFGLGVAAGAVTLAASGARALAAPTMALLMNADAGALCTLMERLSKAPRRRTFKTVPMILTQPAEWDHEALSEVLAYRPSPKQVWDNTDIASPWLNLMRKSSFNAQIWSFKHPDFLAVSATHGSAQLALYDATIWDKYGLSKMAGEKFKTNTLADTQKAEFRRRCEL